MSKIRVRQLARELGLSRKEVVERLAEAGIPVKSHESFVDEATARNALSKTEIPERKLPQKVKRDKPRAKAKRAKRTRKGAKSVPEPQADLMLSPAAPEELAGINLPEATRDKSVAKINRAKRTKKRKRKTKKTKPVPEPHVDLKPSPEAPEEAPGIEPEPISFPTPPPPEPPLTPPEAETPTGPPMEPERPKRDIHSTEPPVMEEPAPDEEQPPPETEEPVAPTESPEVEEAENPTVPLKLGLKPELIKRVADELGFDVEEIPRTSSEGDDPSSTVSKVVKIPEMITVKELAEKLAISPGEIIKELKKIGIVATADWSLNPGLSRRVAAEFGFDVEVARVEVELLEVMGDVDLGETPEPEQWEDEGQHRLKLDDIHQRIKQGQVRIKVRGEEEEGEKQDEAAASRGTITIPDEPDKESEWFLPAGVPAPGVRHARKELWFLAGAIVTVALVALGLPRERGSQSPEATAPKAISVGQGESVAAVPPPKAEEPPPRPSAQPRVAQPREWKVRHHMPRAGQTEQSRRTVIRIFFDGPPDKNIVEIAFSILPYPPGTLRWREPDRLDFFPTDTLLPSTEYTVSLTPISGSNAEGEYTLLEARWSFTTGEALTYRKDIKPLIAAYCSECHGPKGPAASIPLQTYHDVSGYVVAGRSDKSRLYTFIREHQHHINMAGPNHSTAHKLVIIRDWIDLDGAEE